MEFECVIGVQKQGSPVLRTVEMHTGGEPLRIITTGYPPVSGETILDKRRFVLEHLDHLRKILMYEPRGHNDMYGALLVDKDISDADLAVLFLHNEGYSTMCGHAVLALGRYAIDCNLVKPVSPETIVKMQCPCGLVTAHVQYNKETCQTGRVRFQSVPAFAFAVDQKIDIDGFGPITYDIGYGGAFYALVDVNQFNKDLSSTDIQSLIEIAGKVSKTLRRVVSISHPESADLAFLYGTILTDGCDSKDASGDICVFANSQVDRSPCGSGVTARVAVQYHKNQIKLNQEKLFTQPKVGSEMRAKPVSTMCYGGYDKAVVVEVSGMAHYSGRGEFWCEEEDRLAEGFLVR